jgi:hypothetical protein
MAEIILRSPHPTEGRGSCQLIINGLDVSFDVYDDIELVKVGPDDRPQLQEVGLRVTFALSSLELNGNDATVTDQFDVIARQVAQRVAS